MSNDQVRLVLEHFDSKFDSLIEAFEAMSSLMARDRDVQELKADVKTIKIAVTHTNQDLHRLEQKFEAFEATRA